MSRGTRSVRKKFFDPVFKVEKIFPTLDIRLVRRTIGADFYKPTENRITKPKTTYLCNITTKSRNFLVLYLVKATRKTFFVIFAF